MEISNLYDKYSDYINRGKTTRYMKKLQRRKWNCEFPRIHQHKISGSKQVVEKMVLTENENKTGIMRGRVGRGVESRFSRGLGVGPSSPLGGSVTLAIHAVSLNFSFIFVFIKLQIPSHYKILWFYNYKSMKWRDPRLRKQLTEHS